MALIILLMSGVSVQAGEKATWKPDARMSREARQKYSASLEKEFADQGLSFGSPVFLRFTKRTDASLAAFADDFPRPPAKATLPAYVLREYPDGNEAWLSDDAKKKWHSKHNGGIGELELFVRSSDGTYRLFRRYPIKDYSGNLGPKLRKGDLQAPEGFYEITPSSLNPASRYRLSMDIGYPNQLDRARRRTGSLIMIHGGRASAGCFAMGDDQIDEIYTIVEKALRSGQEKVPVHVFPFPLTEKNLGRFGPEDSRLKEWKELKPGYEYFERSHMLPRVRVENAHYRFDEFVPDPQGLLKGVEETLQSVRQETAVGDHLREKRLLERKTEPSEDSNERIFATPAD